MIGEFLSDIWNAHCSYSESLKRIKQDMIRHYGALSEIELEGKLSSSGLTPYGLELVNRILLQDGMPLDPKDQVLMYMYTWNIPDRYHE